MFALPTSMAYKTQGQCVYVCVREGADSCKMASQTLMGRQNPDIQASTPLPAGPRPELQPGGGLSVCEFFAKDA